MVLEEDICPWWRRQHVQTHEKMTGNSMLRNPEVVWFGGSKELCSGEPKAEAGK